MTVPPGSEQRTRTAGLSRRRRLAFGIAAVVLAAAVSSLALLAIDIHLHGRFERSAGFNVWGYRGPSVGRKQAAEYRIAVLGGSAAYGYGVTWDEAFPARLERKLAPRSSEVPRVSRVSVVNLAYNNEGAFAFKPTLDDYAWLRYDLVCLYEGYNDLIGDSGRPNVSVFRHESPLFRLTGYLPIVPIVFKEKAAAMLAGGNSAALYSETGKTVFRPGLATKTSAEILRASAQIAESLEHQLGRIVTEPRHEITDIGSTGCRYPWQQYCRSVMAGVEAALRRNAQVLVVTQPYQLDFLRARQAEQQSEMAAMLRRKFGGDARVQYLNLGDDVDLGDPTLSFDRMHLTAAGNERIAAALVDPVLEMARRRTAVAP